MNCLLIITLITLFKLEFGIGEYIPPGPRYRCPEKSNSIYPCKCLKGSDKGLFVRCDNSNLASLTVSLNNIANLKLPVENLTISNGNFESLFGPIFFKIKARVLNIISTPIKNIEKHAFFGINETLQELHIIGTHIKEFPAEAFKVLGNLTVLNIDNHNIETLKTDILFESLLVNRLEKFHFINGLLEEFPFEAFQAFRKLKTLDLHGNNLSALKRNQFKNLRELEVLDLSYNNITTLESYHIADLTKLIWCNVSHNAIKQLSRGAFARNTVLKVLNMSYNNITRLDANSFRGMRFLRRLYMSDNQISDVGRGTFGSITRIGTIDLARNLITKIDYQMFAQLNYIEVINVAENKITEIQKQSFKDLYLTKINISHNEVSTIENFAFENCANMTLLDLSYNNLTGIDSNVFDSTTYATELQLSYNYFTDMAGIPLHNMTGIKILNATHNFIETIPKNTFPKLYELHTIDLSYNKLNSISNAVFQNLFSLRFLNLSYNEMEEIKSPTFGTLSTLLELNLSHNKLRSIARGGMAKLTSLRNFYLNNNELEKLFQIPISLTHLDLRFNQIKEIPENTWPRMNSLLYLDLSHNNIGDNIKSDSFTSLLTLQTLRLNSNGITKTFYNKLSDLTTLQYLYLEYNNITHLDNSAFGKLPVLFEINLSYNQIHNISNNAFNGLLQLLKLNLSSNSLRTISNNAFEGLVSLRDLDLSYNLLEGLHNKSKSLLEHCLSLERLNVSHNRINLVNRKTFPSDPYIPYKLNHVDLSYNKIPILTFDLTYGTRKLKYLNISNNLILDIRKYIIGNLTSLEILDLSNNRIEDLVTEHGFEKLPRNLTQIYLQNNEIFNIPFNEFENLTQLQILNLESNKLKTFPQQLIDKLNDNGTFIYYEKNPINCDCKLRPLQHFILKKFENSKPLLNIECESPQHLTMTKLKDISDEQLQCIGENVQNSDNNTNDKQMENDYSLLTDIEFREIFYHQSKVTIRWYVTSTRDVSGFYVSLRNENNEIFFDQHLIYDKRFIEIPADIINEAYLSSSILEICVLTKNSLNVIGQWFDSQCIKIPKDFKKTLNISDGQFIIAKKNNKNINDRKNSKLRNKSSGANKANIIDISIYISILILNFLFIIF
ncbi:toll-like receptor 3 [Condylostylus longicornis]|uniref:toll-like receptor 3 n=1 Tax=Condylostylus longicornis TaxID=2530218 RepID=UPI00244E1535|nr:toll-like receptor 3 [Condylostylus longicornis]